MCIILASLTTQRNSKNHHHSTSFFIIVIPCLCNYFIHSLFHEISCHHRKEQRKKKSVRIITAKFLWIHPTINLCEWASFLPFGKERKLFFCILQFISCSSLFLCTYLYDLKNNGRRQTNSCFWQNYMLLISLWSFFKWMNMLLGAIFFVLFKNK